MVLSLQIMLEGLVAVRASRTSFFIIFILILSSSKTRFAQSFDTLAPQSDFMEYKTKKFVSKGEKGAAFAAPNEAICGMEHLVSIEVVATHAKRRSRDRQAIGSRNSDDQRLWVSHEKTADEHKKMLSEYPSTKRDRRAERSHL